MGRPIGSASKLEERRRKAVELVEQEGLTKAEVARRLKVDVRTIHKWMEWKHGKRGLAARPTPGRPSRLGPADLRKLERILLKGAAAAGFSTELWTCPRIAQVIEREFGVRYHVDHVVRLLWKLGWSPQKPEKRAIERDEKKIRGWVHSTWPRIKKKPG